MTHTPGPWKLLSGTYENGSQLKVVPTNRNNTFYALVGGADQDANARLIAAAPELLEKLRMAYHLLKDSTVRMDIQSLLARIEQVSP